MKSKTFSFIFLFLCSVISISFTALLNAEDSEKTDTLGFWPFEHGYGTTAHDLSGNNNHGTISGATWTTDCVGGSHALSFNGSDDYINCGNDSSLNITKYFSIEAWIKPNSLSGSMGIVSKLSGTSNKQYGLTTDEDTIQFHYETASNNYFLYGGALTIGTWQHIAVTVDDSLNILIYVNGDLKISDIAPAETFPTEEPVIIGKVAGTYNSQFFDGIIDEVIIYNRVLTAEEIAEHADTTQSTAIGPVSQSGDDIRIYPNPSYGVFNIKVSETFNLDIIDLTGRIVKKQVLNSDINTVNIPKSGIYFLRFTNNKTSDTHKIIIRK